MTLLHISDKKKLYYTSTPAQNNKLIGIPKKWRSTHGCSLLAGPETETLICSAACTPGTRGTGRNS
eukprot:1206825-Rhodomonas_salina.1